MSCMLGVPARESGYAVLEILGEEGWDVAIVAHELGVEVSARRGDHAVAFAGETVVDVALLVLDAGRRADAACAI